MSFVSRQAFKTIAAVFVLLVIAAFGVVAMIAISKLVADLNKPITRSETIGIYVASFGVPPETIEVREDGSYLHHYYRRGKIVNDCNKWTLDPDGSEIRLTFCEFTMGDAWKAHAGAFGFWPPSIERHFELRDLSTRHFRLRLTVDPDDENLYFEKTDSAPAATHQATTDTTTGGKP